jgi:hypothetical protein
VRGARATAALDGVAWTLDEVRAAERRTQRPNAAVVLGALRVQAELPLVARDLTRAPRQVFARLHALAAAGLVPDEALGRPRGAEPVAVDPLVLGAAPSAAEVEARLDALASLLTGGTSAPAVVVSAVAHGELLALRPFARGNEVVARAVERLALRTRGLDPDSLAVPETGHLATGPAYGDAARAYCSGTASGVAEWVTHCGRAIVAGAQEGLAVCEALGRG